MVLNSLRSSELGLMPFLFRKKERTTKLVVSAVLNGFRAIDTGRQAIDLSAIACSTKDAYSMSTQALPVNCTFCTTESSLLITLSARILWVKHSQFSRRNTRSSGKTFSYRPSKGYYVLKSESLKANSCQVHLSRRTRPLPVYPLRPICTRYGSGSIIIYNLAQEPPHLLSGLVHPPLTS